MFFEWCMSGRERLQLSVVVLVLVAAAFFTVAILGTVAWIMSPTMFAVGVLVILAAAALLVRDEIAFRRERNEASEQAVRNLDEPPIRLNRREAATVCAALRFFARTPSEYSPEENLISHQNGAIDALSNEEIEELVAFIAAKYDLVLNFGEEESDNLAVQRAG